MNLISFCIVSSFLLINCSKSTTHHYLKQKTNSDNNGSLNERITDQTNNGTKNSQLVIDDKNITEKKRIKLNMKQGLMMNQVLSFYTLTETENELCKNQSKEFSDGLRNFEPWALKS